MQTQSSLWSALQRLTLQDDSQPTEFSQSEWEVSGEEEEGDEESEGDHKDIPEYTSAIKKTCRPSARTTSSETLTLPHVFETLARSPVPPIQLRNRGIKRTHLKITRDAESVSAQRFTNSTIAGDFKGGTLLLAMTVRHTPTMRFCFVICP